MANKAVIVLSGGQDSTTCLYWAKARGLELHAITFDYGQRHRREIQAAIKVAQMAGVVTHRVVELGYGHQMVNGRFHQVGGVLEGTSPLVDPNAELEQYHNHQSLPGGLEKTFVPMRNQLFLTIAANRAYVLGTRMVVTGVSAEDYGGYPDCRQDFINALELVSSLGTFTGKDGALPALFISTPLMHMNKRETVELACRIDGCYEALAFSHTSYDGEYPPTGKDHATLLRQKGFEAAGIPDPLILRAHIKGDLKELPEHESYYGSRASYYRSRIEAVL
jgi:7-cyano-7-deazaguanine synthase